MTTHDQSAPRPALGAAPPRVPTTRRAFVAGAVVAPAMGLAAGPALAKARDLHPSWLAEFLEAEVRWLTAGEESGGSDFDTPACIRWQ